MDLSLLGRTTTICVIILAGGCAHPPRQHACSNVGGMPMVEYQLFFGRDIAGRPGLTDQEWAEFAEQVVTPRLPDGFTAFDAGGQWMNPATRRIIREKTKVVIVALPDTEAAASAIGEVRDTYRARFHQQSVGMIAHPICGAF
jgi:hypothetical protein